MILGPSGSGGVHAARTAKSPRTGRWGFIQIDGDYIGYRRKGDKLYEMKERRVADRRRLVLAGTARTPDGAGEPD
ncbi:hypothetical protein MJ561_16030 [Klebsiella pneumoniae]|nr:hypothetical protein MJ561_16030 [Klebsiella pneumoniae]